MNSISPNLNIMIKACEKASKVIIRDFGEIENLQVAKKGPRDFVTKTDKRVEKILIEELTKAKKNYHKFIFRKDDILLFGRESAGVPEVLHKTIKNKVKVPMNKKTRSLNVAMCVAIVSAEALRQNKLLK